MEAWGLTDPGVVRSQNQDYYDLRELEDGSTLAVVCDGMGGAKAGNIASRLAVDVFVKEVRRMMDRRLRDDEVQEIANFIKRTNAADYSDEVMAEIDKKAAESGKNSGASNAGAAPDAPDDGDEMLPAAVEVILETGQASVSMLQRRLKLGYARAARIMDEMEERGIVGHFEGSKPRQLLITKEQWQTMQSGQQMTIPEEDYNPPVEEEIL